MPETSLTTSTTEILKHFVVNHMDPKKSPSERQDYVNENSKSISPQTLVMGKSGSVNSKVTSGVLDTIHETLARIGKGIKGLPPGDPTKKAAESEFNDLTRRAYLQQQQISENSEALKAISSKNLEDIRKGNFGPTPLLQEVQTLQRKIEKSKQEIDMMDKRAGVLFTRLPEKQAQLESLKTPQIGNVGGSYVIE